MRLWMLSAVCLVVAGGAHAIPGDLDRDGDVDFDDFFAFADNFGRRGTPDPEARLQTNGVYWRLADEDIPLVEYLRFRPDGTMLRHLAIYLAPWDMYGLTPAIALQMATYQVTGCCQLLASNFDEPLTTGASSVAFTVTEGNLLHSVAAGFGSYYNYYSFPPPAQLPRVTFRAGMDTVWDTVYVSLDDRLRTVMHERSGYGWDTNWGWVGTTSRWRFLAYRTIPTGIAVSGTYEITWENKTTSDLATAYHPIFYDASGFKIADYYYTGPTGVKIINQLTVAIRAGGERTISEPFEIQVPSLAVANTIETMGMLAHGWQAGP